MTTTSTTPASRHVRLLRWTAEEIAAGLHADEPVSYADPFADRGAITYQRRSWTSAVVDLRFDVTSAVASWTATTPPGTWIEVAAREHPGAPWLVVGRWAETDEEIHRTTVHDQRVNGATVDTDEVKIEPTDAWRSAQVRVSLLMAGGDAWPVVTSTALVLAGQPEDRTGSRAGERRPPVLVDVPPLSQQLYRDELAEFGGGGQNWCSPTAVSMVLSHWGVGPEQRPVVAYAATQTYDHAYRGTGNWAFNIAYAGRFGLDAFVTRLRSLGEAERIVRAAIPLVLSLSFTRDELDGAGFDTEGHLVVLIGFDEGGDPIVNDPASHTIASADEVRTTYRRDQLERAWLRGSGGATYVIHPPDVRLPRPSAEANW